MSNHHGDDGDEIELDRLTNNNNPLFDDLSKPSLASSSSESIPDILYEDQRQQRTPLQEKIAYFKRIIPNLLIGLTFLTCLSCVFFPIAATQPEFENLTYVGWMTAVIVIITISVLTTDLVPPHFTVVCAMMMFEMCKILTPSQAIAGFANTSVFTIAVVLIITEAMSKSGVLVLFARYILGKPRFMIIAQIRLLYAVLATSAFVPDTPTVCVYYPVVLKFCREMNFKPSFFMMPLSYAALLGGTITIIGTSTNLVIKGLVDTYQPPLDIELGFFDIAVCGLPVGIVGVAYMIIFNRCCLPSRDPQADLLTVAREYTGCAYVPKNSSLVGKNIKQGGLSHLKGVYLYEIQREDGEVLVAPDREVIILAGDRLWFTGPSEGMENVFKIDGLSVAEDRQVEKIKTSGRRRRYLIEAVLSYHSDMVGKTAKQVKFRERYNAAIIAIGRQGAKLNEQIGKVELRGGDTLLIEGTESFLKRYKKDKNFSLVAELNAGSVMAKRNYFRMLACFMLLAIPVTANAMSVFTVQQCGLCSCCIIVILGYLSLDEALACTKPDVLLLIAASFSLGAAVNNTGLGADIGNFILPILEKAGTFGVLLGTFIIVSLATSFVSNAATATIMFPIVITFALKGAVSLRSVILIMMMAGSADFTSPVGYQTNLMMKPLGGYHFLHYTAFGLPLVCIDGLLSSAICYFLYE